jgi:hypothetical protein
MYRTETNIHFNNLFLHEISVFASCLCFNSFRLLHVQFRILGTEDNFLQAHKQFPFTTRSSWLGYSVGLSHLDSLLFYYGLSVR